MYSARSRQNQARLLKRVGWLWSLSRFRAGPQPIASAEALLESGQLTIIADRVARLETSTDGRQRAGLGSGEIVTADTVINCSGAGRDRLVSRLIDDGVIAAHPAMTRRPAVTGDLRLLREDQTPHDSLFALGPVTAHAYGDVIGAATISRQAQILAGVIPGQNVAMAQTGDNSS